MRLWVEVSYRVGALQIDHHHGYYELVAEIFQNKKAGNSLQYF